VLDFELAAMNAAREIFPDTAIKECLFNFSQKIWRKVVNSGLRVVYINENKNDVRKLMTVSFEPEVDVAQVFEDIVQNVHEEVLQICDHVELFFFKRRPAKR